MIERSSIDNLQASVDISDLISSYVPLKKNGAHSFVGLCPFHDDRRASMHVSSDKGLYHCFACGAGGNIFGFVMEIENIDFPSAVEKIADMFNFELSYTKDNKSANEFKSAKNVLSLLNASYKLALFSPAGASALNYLKSRGINDAMIERFELGWAGANSATINCLQNEGVPPSDALRAGAIKQNESGFYASFIERITFPIYNHLGALVGFGGRTISNHPAKYVNSPQSEIFDKSRVLYGYDKAKNAIFKQKQMIICEGYMDCIMLHLAGFDNAVAVLGTALTTKHLPLIKKENIKVILSFDSDSAGQNAAFKSAGLLAQNGIDGRVVLISGGKDPAELVADGKTHELREFYKGGVEFVEFYIRKIAQNMPLNTPNERAHALDEIRGFTRSLRPEIISFYEPLVSSLLGIDAHQLHLGANSRANNGYNAGFKGSLNYQNNAQNGANFRQNYNASKGHQNQQNARYQSPQNAPANALKTQENKDMLRLSILKNMLANASFYEYAKSRLTPQMFSDDGRYFSAVINNPNDENNALIREINMDESLEEYDESSFKQAINRLTVLYFERQIAVLLSSNDANKSAKIKNYRLAIDKLKQNKG